MKLADLEPIIHSAYGDIQLCTIYERDTGLRPENGCSAEYACKHYGKREIERVSTSYENGSVQLVLTII